MRSSYSEEDVILLLKDITGMVEPQPAKVREKLIQSGKHYSEMLPVEYVPTDQYMQVYHNALKHYAKPVANAVGMLADKIIENKGKKMVLVSLARAGIPIGILVKRYIKFKYGINVPHYSISIIRGRGIDDNAMKYLLEKYRPQQILFVDGWIGKGAILNELNMENTPDLEKIVESQGIDEVINIGKNFGIDDINLIKPGIGETTRVLLRRIPWKVLIDERYKGNPQLEHIVRLAEEKHTPVEYYPLTHYKCCGIIKKLADA